jgi:hypothetical protein
MTQNIDAVVCCLQMQMWAESKQQPGHFTGTTGARVLSAAELASGFQAWAKKVQEVLRRLTVCVFQTAGLTRASFLNRGCFYG